MKVNKMNLYEEGLNRFFGPLEARIMQKIWDSGESSIKEVQQFLNEMSPISFNAIMTVMNRLWEKGHLKKQVHGRSSYFEAIQTKEQFLVEQTKAVTRGLMEEFGNIIVNQMIESLDRVEPESLKKLEAKLNEMKRRSLP